MQHLEIVGSDLMSHQLLLGGPFWAKCMQGWVVGLSQDSTHDTSHGWFHARAPEGQRPFKEQGPIQSN